MRLELEGFEAIDFSKPHIIVANHQSKIDVCVSYRALPVPLRFVLKQELAHVPLVGWYARAMGMVFIEREAARKAARRLQDAHELFAAGDSLCAFPEGTRSRDGRVGSFKGGVFKLAIESGVPILPVAIEGSGAGAAGLRFSRATGLASVCAAGEPIANAGTAGVRSQHARPALSRCRDCTARPGRARTGPGRTLRIRRSPARA